MRTRDRATPAQGVTPAARGGEELVHGAAQALLDAVMAISADLDLDIVLTRIVRSATRLTGARYGALGVLAPDGRSLAGFVTVGVDPVRRAMIGAPPRGLGVLGLVIEHPEPIRIDDLRAHPAAYGFPEHHPSMTTFLGVPIQIRGTPFGNLYLTEKAGGTPFTEQDEMLVGALAAVAGFVVEHARDFGVSERRRRWLEASAELADALRPPLLADAALQQVTRTVRAVAGALAVAVVPLDQSSAAPRAVAVDEGDADRVAAALREVTGAVRRQQLSAEGDEADDADEAARPSHPGGPLEPVELRAAGLDATAVPLRAQLAERCVLVALSEPSAAHDPEEQQLLVSIADQAALALDRVAAMADREELAVVSDRERIARDLHDTVIQRLFATGLQLQAASMVAVNPEVVDRLERAVADLDLTIRDIRGTIFELQGRASDGHGPPDPQRE